MSNIYDIVYTKINQWLTPPEQQQPKTLALLNAFVRPVLVKYQNFLLYRKAKLYELYITPQKCYLERLLNDRYDNVLRRIYIDDGVDKDPRYIYQVAELKPMFVYTKAEGQPQFIYTLGESGQFTNDFVIFCPQALAFEDAEMTSLVKVYKLAGTKFKIQRF